jgi:hypothetical protein
MSLPTQKPATTPIPVQLSEHDFTTFILPHLSIKFITIYGILEFIPIKPSVATESDGPGSYAGHSRVP